MKQLDPKAIWFFFINTVWTWIVLILIVGSIWGTASINIISQGYENGLIGFGLLTVGVLMIILFLVLSYIWAKLTYRFYRYELTDIGFRKEYGVIYKKYVTIPYDRIQNVDIYRGILARLLGLSDIHIQTAGSSNPMGGEGRLPALSKEEAEILRDEVLRRAKSSRTNQGL